MALLYTARRSYLYRAHLQMLPDYTLPTLNPVLEHKTAGEHRPHCKGEIQVSGTLHIKLNSFQGCYGLIWQKTMKYIHNLC